jgi:Metal binding domain of Ada
MTARTYTLLGSDRQPYQSTTPGALGGYRPARIYGRLDCPPALRAIARGQYVRNRVFFADEQTAVAAGYRPCAVCLPDAYAQWRAAGLSEVGAAGDFTHVRCRERLGRLLCYYHRAA